MTIKQLVQEIRKKKSFLSIGLDVDLKKIPPHLLKDDDPVFAFNKAIIDATQHLTVAYKPNTAFYEAMGIEGWKSLEKTIAYLNSEYPQIFTIADAKRGDIGNTSGMYARAFFETLNFDSVTLAPYMGKDSIEPFLKYKDKYSILLALTSNEGAGDFQTGDQSGEELFEKVIRTSRTWVNSQNLMYVLGATRTEYIARVRKLVPESFFLVPGVGAQGGSLEEVCSNGMNDNVGLLINSSRGIIYASKDEDFAQAAAEKAGELQKEMQKYL
ncbi:MAG TPA: orotidine-5'-phosphate decarboxylase [Salinimicrobium sp.]|nr:orotidine-5'-phosphate decarboxylase [Salinimicrobium sp.]